MSVRQVVKAEEQSMNTYATARMADDKLLAEFHSIAKITEPCADDEEPDPSLIREAIESLQDIDEEELEEEREEIADEKEEKPNKGLMARRGSK